MKLFGLILIALGAYMMYAAYKKKMIKTKDGETLDQMQSRLMKSDPNEALKTGMNAGCSMYLKYMGFVFGIVLILIGLMFLAW